LSKDGHACLLSLKVAPTRQLQNYNGYLLSLSLKVFLLATSWVAAFPLLADRQALLHRQQKSEVPFTYAFSKPFSFFIEHVDYVITCFECLCLL
jgi:hypothetical protein